MDSKTIRDQFMTFFKARQHNYIAGSPVAPQDDPSLLFVNAGMNQFKGLFLGITNRSYTRAVNSQLCIRVSGKHNDLEAVGRDSYHHTLFEMLGNWSFGDYYKEEAIEWAWELLTTIYKIPKEKLYATVYHDDNESFQIWQKVTDIQESHIMRFGDKDNFWEMAETGPCGPCSEIHVDCGDASCDHQGVIGHICQVNGECSRYIELWNLVFIQYDRQVDQTLKPLTKKHVDTGAGLERISAYLQGKKSNYDTDLFEPIINRISDFSGHAYTPDGKGMPHRVMADHIRTLSMGIADNVRLSNEGRGYVLRRLLRRAMCYAKKLDITQPFLYRLVDTFCEIMGDTFPQLNARKKFIKDSIKAEEYAFLKTLDIGVTLFQDILKKIKQENNALISGALAFKLYDTYGFPIDLTQVMAEEENVHVDRAEFETLLKAQKAKSRASRSSESDKRKPIKYPVSLSREACDSLSKISLHISPYTDGIPRGGEARYSKNKSEQVQMARHHSATHLLQAALQEILGSHTQQAGSLVDIDRLRFDFTHTKSVSEKEILEIETRINQEIQAKTPINTYTMPLEEAKSLGIIALFGEKYEDTVRVVDIGPFSKELCGGTHVQNTADIEAFKLIQETAVSTGVRRIEAIVGHFNIESYDQNLKEVVIKEIRKKHEPYKTIFLVPEKLKSLSLTQLHQEKSKLEKAIKQSNKEKEARDRVLQTNLVETLLDAVGQHAIMGSCLIHYIPGLSLPQLRELSDQLRQNTSHALLILGSDAQGKGVFFVYVASPLNETLRAHELIKKLTAIAGGGGGGKANTAQAGGADPKKVQDALSQLARTLDVPINPTTWQE